MYFDRGLLFGPIYANAEPIFIHLMATLSRGEETEALLNSLHIMYSQWAKWAKGQSQVNRGLIMYLKIYITMPHLDFLPWPSSCRGEHYSCAVGIKSAELLISALFLFSLGRWGWDETWPMEWGTGWRQPPCSVLLWPRGFKYYWKVVYD